MAEGNSGAEPKSEDFSLPRMKIPRLGAAMLLFFASFSLSLPHMLPSFPSYYTTLPRGEIREANFLGGSRFSVEMVGRSNGKGDFLMTALFVPTWDFVSVVPT